MTCSLCDWLFLICCMCSTAMLESQPPFSTFLLQLSKLDAFNAKIYINATFGSSYFVYFYYMHQINRYLYGIAFAKLVEMLGRMGTTNANNNNNNISSLVRFIGTWLLIWQQLAKIFPACCVYNGYRLLCIYTMANVPLSQGPVWKEYFPMLDIRIKCILCATFIN